MSIIGVLGRLFTNNSYSSYLKAKEERDYHTGSFDEWWDYQAYLKSGGKLNSNKFDDDDDDDDDDRGRRRSKKRDEYVTRSRSSRRRHKH